MQRHAAIARSWMEEGRRAALVRVTDAAGLGPRVADEILLVDESGLPAGSLLGGALDSELTSAATDLLADPARSVATLSLDVSHDDAESAGLTCGGYVHVLVQRLDDVPVQLWDALVDGRPAALTTALDGEAGAIAHVGGRAPEGSLGSAALDDLARATASPLLALPGHHVSRARLDDVELIVEAWHPVPQLVVVGGSAISEALVAQAGVLGWPASIVTTRDEAVTAVTAMRVSDVVVVVDHDHDLATAVLVAALQGEPFYVGALGARHTQVERMARLERAGVGSEALERYHGPTGLDLGARSPAESAVSIVAEILAVRSGRPAAPLGRTAGRIGG
ncbi:MAG TPA: XdhC family protein [Acidimicrobiales bacterium]|nr:XdhC family protein [Acidimicrobiales bacterium]